MSFIKANKYALQGLSSSVYSGTKGKTSMLFKVWVKDGVGYCKYTPEVEANIDFEFELVDEIPVDDE